jgi:valyl-tRNA synthetase
MATRPAGFPARTTQGIATQAVVEMELRKEGKTRKDLGREAFLARVWQWKEKYGNEIIQQLKAMGCSCDWSRLRFTLDPGLSRAVRTAFVRLYREGLIYRGEYMIHWCPRCETALSDIEVEHEEVDGHLYFVRYPLEEGGAVTVATTRPETMLGDTALAVNPHDERHKHLIGKTAILPVLGRRLPIVAAEEVDPEFGTGVLKITPAHDPVDFQIGKRLGLPAVNIFNPDGTVNEEGGPFAGMDRYEARKAMVERLEAEGLLERVLPYRHAVGHCHRCHTQIEPRISTQWFVRMKPLAEPAIEVVRAGKIRFIPRALDETLFRVAGEHPRLVHLPAALVGPSHPRLVRPGRPDHRGHGRGGSEKTRPRNVRKGCGNPPGRGCARYLVFLGPLALLRHGLAG